MPRQGRKVKTRRPRIVDGAIGFLILVWIWPLSKLYPRNTLDLTTLLISILASAVIIGVAVIALRQQNAAGKSLADLQAMSPDVFEDWVSARFRDLGYSVKTAGAQGDHGVDLLFEKPGEYAVIQCKNYRAWSVGEPILRDLFGAMHDFKADHAYLVTTGRLTQPAIKWAEGKPITVWDGDKVAQLSKEVVRKPAPAARSAPTEAAPPAESTAPMQQVSMPAPASPGLTCPRCGSALVERRARATGQSFLGCSRYPACCYTQPLLSA